jgi:hypothetical protein
LAVLGDVSSGWVRFGPPDHAGSLLASTGVNLRIESGINKRSHTGVN